MHELPSVTDAQLANNPIGVLCTLSRRLLFQKLHRFSELKNVLRTASVTARVYEKGFEPGLIFEPLMNEGCLPRYFVVHRSSGMSGHKLDGEKMFNLMQIVGVLPPDVLPERGRARIDNQAMIALLTQGETDGWHRSQTLFSGKDSQGDALIIYSRRTKLPGARLEVGISETQQLSPDLDLAVVQIEVTGRTYAADRYLHLSLP